MMLEFILNFSGWCTQIHSNSLAMFCLQLQVDHEILEANVALLGTTPKTSVTVAMMLAVTAPVVARCFADGWCRNPVRGFSQKKDDAPMMFDFG